MPRIACWGANLQAGIYTRSLTRPASCFNGMRVHKHPTSVGNAPNVHHISSACGRSFVCFVFDPASKHSPKTKHTKLLPQADERRCKSTRSKSMRRWVSLYSIGWPRRSLTRVELTYLVDLGYPTISNRYRKDRPISLAISQILILINPMQVQGHLGHPVLLIFQVLLLEIQRKSKLQYEVQVWQF